MLLPFVVSMTRADWRLLFSCRVVQIVSLFLGYLLLSLVWSPPRGVEFVYDSVRYTLLTLGFVCAVAWVCSRSISCLDRFLIVLVPTATAVLVYSVWIFYADHSFPSSRLSNMVFYRDNPIRGSVGFAFVALLGLAVALNGRRRALKAMGLIGLSVSLLFLLLAQSRGLLLGVAAGAALQLVWHRYWKCLAFSFAILVLGVAALEFSDSGARGFIERADSQRLEIWAGTAERISSAPILGEGIGADTSIVGSDGREYYSPHNVIFMSALVGGLVGLFLFLVVVGASFWRVGAHAPRDPCGFLGGSLLVCGLVFSV